MTPSHLSRALLAAAMLAVSLPSVAGAATPPPEPCLTLAADDGHEPVCNPWLWQSSWDQGHRNPYSQHTAPVTGPRPGEPVAVQRIGLAAGSPIGVTLGGFFSGRYADGKRVVWGLSVIGVNDNPIYKVDPETGQVIDTYQHTTDGDGLPSERAALSGIYILSDRHGHIIQPRGDRFEVYGDARPGDRLSPIASLHQFVLPARARCGSGDRLVGQTMRWDGRIGFVTERGMVGVVPADIEQMDDAHLVVHSINGAQKCATADDSTDGLETVSNSLSGDETGAMFPVTNRAQYRFDVAGDAIRQVWRTPYKTGTTSSVRQDDGSGSTPALMGTDPGDDKFVVITDGQPLTHLVLFRRDTGKVACEVPLNFGDSSLTEAQNEQSVAIRGYAALIPNNQLRNAGQAEAIYGPLAAASGLPLQLAVAGFAGSAPAFQPYGAERVDWDPASQSCKVRWVNTDVSLPNGVPTMSPGANMVYGLGVRNGVWGLEGIDFDTGRSALWVPADADPLTNSFYSALSIAPDGSVWSGALQGLTVFRPPARPEPARVCKEFEAPVAAFGRLRVTGRRLSVRGTASDTGCGGIRKVTVSISRADGHGRCRFVASSGRLGAARSCRRLVWVAARGGASWRRPQTARLPRGRYAVRVRARDGAGNVGRTRARRVVLR